MGGQQSSASGSETGRGTRGAVASKTCYYDLLEVDQAASSDDIRKAYRRKALELHPDKNITDVENATQRFAEVQTAYDILSDPQERAWYDSHKDAILQGQEVDDVGQDPSHFRNVRVTSADDIVALVGRFNASVPFTDELTGFFGSLREIFDQLAAEETALGDHGDRLPVSYPPFGTSTSDYDTIVKSFYSGWSGFATRKTFSWKDKYRLPDAPDRRVRRLMEKENKKCREDAMREFNDSVRFLVGFARKRDPRFLPNTQSQADRQKALREIVAAQAARSRAANQEKRGESIVADWVQAGRDNEPANGMSSSEEETHVEQIECVVCSKLFKSENQYIAHERSKKHVKAVQQLRREMRKQNRDLDLESSANGQRPEAPELSPSPKNRTVSSDAPDPTTQTINAEAAERLNPITELSYSAPGEECPSPAARDREEDETKVARSIDELESTPMENADLDTQQMPRSFSSLDNEGGTCETRVGKAKTRRAKKAAREGPSSMEMDSGMTCQLCGATFSSRTKLFTHIREKNHAALRQQLPNEVIKKKKKRSGNG